jgi:hypothetical protein
MVFSDQSAPATLYCPQSRTPLNVDSEKPQTEEEVESEITQSDSKVIESEVSEDDADDSSLLSKSSSVQGASNPNLRTTKTGKIKHKSRKIGVNKKSTAYNRFLQQRSKILSEQLSDWTPQQVPYSPWTCARKYNNTKKAKTKKKRA